MTSGRMRATRLFTALTVVGICVLAIVRGWETVRFLMAAADESSDANRIEAVRPWFDVPGVAFFARVSALTVVADSNDEDAIGKRLDELSGIVSVRPMSSEHWLTLSGLRLISGQDSNKALAALAFSALIGPNEGHVMFERAFYGLILWDDLPAPIRKRTATDLAAVELTDTERARLQLILSAKTDEIRQNIKTVLETEGLSAKNLSGIGL